MPYADRTEQEHSFQPHNELPMIDKMKHFWKRYPLRSILLIALIVRLVAVVFAKGYGMHDDHFGPIEQPFLIMHDIAVWTDRGEPHGHSIVYPLIHYALFNGFEVLGIRDPQTTMFFVRLLHALYSLLIVGYGFKIAEILTTRETARRAGLLLAIFWAFPFLSVRNLVEVVCIPPLAAGFYYALTSREKVRNALIAGLCFGLAFVFRYQTLALAGTVGLIFLFKKEFKQTALLAAGFLLTAVAIQGSADVFAWGYPFASFVAYLTYNVAHGQDYTTGPWYRYILLVAGALIPPTSLLLLYGFFRNWKKTILIVLPVLVFFILHSAFPNKQERFIFPVVPFIVLLGFIGWEEFAAQSKFWLRHRAALKASWIWFWTVNTALLVLFSTYYSKKSRVEAMYAMYGRQVHGIILEGGQSGTTFPPLFYTGVFPVPVYEINNEDQLLQTKARVDTSRVRPNYVVFFGPDSLDRRVQRIESTLGLELALERKIEPSLLDDVFYRLNPRFNKNETTFVFKTETE
jgi:hypothetical protein